MKISRNTIYALGVIIAAVAVFELWFFLGHGHLWPVQYPTDEVIRSITVMQSGGSSLLVAECADKNYVGNASDYIIEGLVENVESRWNEQKTSILTYTDLEIKKYLKGIPFAETTEEKFKVVATHLAIITPGGCVARLCQSVEDQPIFHKGKAVRIYFKENNGDFQMVCGNMGVEDLHWN